MHYEQITLHFLMMTQASNELSHVLRVVPFGALLGAPAFRPRLAHDKTDEEYETSSLIIADNRSTFVPVNTSTFRATLY